MIRLRDHIEVAVRIYRRTMISDAEFFLSLGRKHLMHWARGRFVKPTILPKGFSQCISFLYKYINDGTHPT